MIPFSIYRCPACFHASVCIQIIPFFSYRCPACFHTSIFFIQIIPMSIYRCPACFHNSIFVKVIPFSINCFPANYFLSVFSGNHFKESIFCTFYQLILIFCYVCATLITFTGAYIDIRRFYFR